MCECKKNDKYRVWTKLWNFFLLRENAITFSPYGWQYNPKYTNFSNEKLNSTNKNIKLQIYPFQNFLGHSILSKCFCFTKFILSGRVRLPWPDGKVKRLTLKYLIIIKALTFLLNTKKTTKLHLAFFRQMIDLNLFCDNSSIVAFNLFVSHMKTRT